ncbi:HIT family protein [Salinisphaera sp. Q1T1-3]|uniref:HIT family protein n=1 Tax=Salinisphaera sp. Q1T1-3 TaxID=2321229 RepID=UPI001314DF12|nr:HIT family protein [Salinisphaera sp. Q1T1-3]
MSSVAPTAARQAASDPIARLHPRLVADCHVIGRLERATVLLHRHAAIGWLLLVPDTDATDWQELDDAEYERIALQLRQLSAFACDWFEADKMNVAAIGNEVAQLHIHVVARQYDDVCWPKPVWGHLPGSGPAYDAETLERLITDLSQALRLSRIESARG